MNETNIILSVLQILGLYVLLITIFYIYKTSTTSELVRKHYKKKVIRNSVFIVILLIIFALFRIMTSTFGISSRSLNSSGIPNADYVSGPNFSYTSKMMPSLFLPPQNNENSITDTREFLKKNFYSNIQTRKVETVAKKVQLLIKGSGGRIDSSNIASTNAYFSFVIPKSELDNFEEQIRTYTNPKLYSQSISTQNLLTEKQNLEQNQQKNQDDISVLTAEQKATQSNYKKQSTSLNQQINIKQSEVNNIDSTIAKTSDQSQRIVLITQEQSLNNQIQSLKNELNQVTNSFKNQMTNLGVSLDQQSKILAGLNNQENDFFNNIETVNGSVNINYISIWQMLTKLSPINPILIITLILTILKIISVIKKEKKIIVN